MDDQTNSEISQKAKSRLVTEMTADEARSFFLKPESYCTIDLPQYFTFESILSETNKLLTHKSLSELREKQPREYDDINHLILNNKDGRHSWRKLELIHPALYVSLVDKISEESQWKVICSRFDEFSSLSKIKCLSIPVESRSDETDKATQVSGWWQEVEQSSIELALDYDLTAHVDITDCYGAIYTHSIAWALHTKKVAKDYRKDKSLIGNIIDGFIQDMRHGQTNGIPQGSVLMDFIAEMVLGYADSLISEKISNKIEDYRILRYRDDYRVLSNESRVIETILKYITEVLIDLGFKLNSGKTFIGNQLISAAIKKEKEVWIGRKKSDKNLQKHLMIIHQHSVEYPNAGSVATALTNYHKRIVRNNRINNIPQLISIIVDLAYRNPRTYPICSAILSKFISLLGDDGKKRSIINRIMKKFNQIPNTGHLQMWLQRISHSFAPEIEFDEPLCKLVKNPYEPIQIWNDSWISSKELKEAINPVRLIDRQKLVSSAQVVSPKEVELFLDKSNYYY